MYANLHLSWPPRVPYRRETDLPALRARRASVSFIAALSPDAREELRAFVQQSVQEILAARERAETRREWLTTESVAALISCSDNAVRCRIRRGWLAGDVARDGNRLLIRRSALLDWLDARARRRRRGGGE
jgi:hypothetical protein